MVHIQPTKRASQATLVTLTGTTIPIGIRMYPIRIGIMCLAVGTYSPTGWVPSCQVLVRDLKILCLRILRLQITEVITSSVKTMFQP